MHKVKQQQYALRIALYILRENGFAQPPKKQVLNFIRLKHLIDFPDEDLEKRYENDQDSIWENDIAWKRKDLFEDGEVDSPKHGHWQLTKKGLDRIEREKEKWSNLESTEERRNVLMVLPYWTEELLQWMLKISKGESLSLHQVEQAESENTRKSNKSSS